MEIAKTIIYGNRTEKECPICLNNVRPRNHKTLPCGHVLHSTCLKNLINSNCQKKCPVCRANLDNNTETEKTPSDFSIQTKCGICCENMNVTESSCQFVKQHNCFFHYKCITEKRKNTSTTTCNCGVKFSLNSVDMISYLWFVNGYEEIVGKMCECKEKGCSIVGNPKRWGYCVGHNSCICTNAAFAKTLQVMVRYVDEEDMEKRRDIFYRILNRLTIVGVSVNDEPQRLRKMLGV